MVTKTSCFSVKSTVVQPCKLFDPQQFSIFRPRNTLHSICFCLELLEATLLGGGLDGEASCLIRVCFLLFVCLFFLTNFEAFFGMHGFSLHSQQGWGGTVVPSGGGHWTKYVAQCVAGTGVIVGMLWNRVLSITIDNAKWLRHPSVESNATLRAFHMRKEQKSETTFLKWMNKRIKNAPFALWPIELDIKATWATCKIICWR